MEIIDIPFHNHHIRLKVKTISLDTVYNFSTDMERIDTMIAWLFEHTIERFVLLGTDRIYFECSADAMAFKLTWDTEWKD